MVYLGSLGSGCSRSTRTRPFLAPLEGLPRARRTAHPVPARSMDSRFPSPIVRSVAMSADAVYGLRPSHPIHVT